MEEKELWPDAGLWLDVEQISAADFFGKVEQRLADIGDTLGQIVFLKRLKIEIDDRAGLHYLALRHLENLEDAAARVKSGAASKFIKSSGAFDMLLTYRLGKLEAIREIEIEERAARRDTPSPVDGEKVEDSPVPGRWTNEQIAVALYALLRAAGLPDNYNKAAVARFTHLLTGRSQDKMKKAGYEAAGGTFSDDGAKAVIEQFEGIGLAKLAGAVRDKDFTKL